MAREVTIVDAGLGNLASVERALVQVGAAVRVSGDPDKVATARMVVFPGQGAFGAATQSIVDGALGAALRMVIERGDPFLGICLGMQMLFDSSDENGGCEGLHILPGHCRKFPPQVFEDAEPGAASPLEPIVAVEPRLAGAKASREPMADSITAALETETERVVQNSFAQDTEEPPSNDDGSPPLQNGPGSELPMPSPLVVPDIPSIEPIAGLSAPLLSAPTIPDVPTPVLAPVSLPVPAENAIVEPLRRRVKVPHVGWNSVEPTGEHYYFVHSYYVEPGRVEDIMWMTTYGGIRFPAAVRHQNVLGCQFHPEKSQRSGLKFLRAFLLGGWG